MLMNRRILMILMLSLASTAVIPLAVTSFAHAKDGDSGKDNDSDDSGSDNSGSDNSGSDNSGRGSGSDDSDRDDSGRDDDDNDDDDDDDDDDDNSGRGKDHDDARDAVRQGRILPLKDVLKTIEGDKYGKVIGVDLKHFKNADVYRMKVRDPNGTIRTLRVNARTGRLIKLFGS